MNPAIRKVGVGLILLLLVLVGQLTYLQIVDANNLNNNPHNVRTLLENANRPRGDIITADGTVVAHSVRVSDTTEFKYLRRYPTGGLFSQVVGYQSFVFGATGVEDTYNSDLTGQSLRVQLHSLGDLLSGTQGTGTVVLSLRDDLQRTAQQALGFQRGSVVMLDVQTGAVLAMYSNPTYDPNPLVVHNAQSAQAAFSIYNANPDHPSLARAYRELYPPGSSFKTVTSSVAIEDGVATPDTQFPYRNQLPLPQTTAILQNFGGETCGGSLTMSFYQSCNATFGQLGLQLGDQFVPGMAKFGIGSAPPLDDAPGAVASVGPAAGSFATNMPQFAFAGIGQGVVAVTPLQMALVAEGLANGGVVMTPHVASEIQDANGKLVERINPSPWMTATTPQVAAAVTQMMIDVVNQGTGTAAQIPGVQVAGKTGTAQNAPNQAPHAWFIAFAPAQAPKYAIAVLVEHGGSQGNDATGGAVAAPIAARMLRTALGLP
ncbi:MAG TPA: penicillin-binding transpeptidase domain-containing protein [Acidimicrobiia bacterium]|nr:penicillin-binding transpeptidase domain-containing protein [Acidimicrobiia bacterium]